MLLLLLVYLSVLEVGRQPSGVGVGSLLLLCVSYQSQAYMARVLPAQPSLQPRPPGTLLIIEQGEVGGPQEVPLSLTSCECLGTQGSGWKGLQLCDCNLGSLLPRVTQGGTIPDFPCEAQLTNSLSPGHPFCCVTSIAAPEASVASPGR